MRVVVLMLIAMPAIARAQPSDSADVSQALAQIAKLEGQLEYERALALVTQTTARGAASRDQLADLNLIGGRLAAGLDHPELAQMFFARVLALRPNTQLVAGTSPKLQAPFDAARALNPTLELQLHVDAGRATVVVTHDPLRLVAGLRATVVALDDSRSELVGGIDVAVPPGRVATLEAIDDHGNQLALESFAIVAPQKPIELPPPATPVLKNWVTYAAVAGVAVVAGGLCAWRFGSAQDEFDRLDSEGGHDYSQLHAIEERGQRWAIGADVSFGIAAIAGVAATILFATREPPIAVTANSVAYVARF